MTWTREPSTRIAELRDLMHLLSEARQNTKGRMGLARLTADISLAHCEIERIVWDIQDAEKNGTI